jgi:hypothetical protein
METLFERDHKNYERSWMQITRKKIKSLKQNSIAFLSGSDVLNCYIRAANCV